MGRPIMKKEEFDSIIRHLVEIEEKDVLFGYIVQNDDGTEKCYDMYYSDEAFEKFVSNMNKQHRQAYEKGAGGELEPKITTINGAKQKYPPKMASVASSSRFCYIALHNGIDDLTIGNEHITGSAEFEKVCVINKNFKSHPHLDAYIPESECYFEVKCHEIFDSHKVVLKKKYWDLLYGEKNDFGFEPMKDPDPKGETFEISLEEFGVYDKPSTMFDIKQLICHLLGIANQEGHNKKLVYLFFFPYAEKATLKIRSELENDILVAYNHRLYKIFTELSEEIETIFNSYPIKTFCNAHNIKLMAISEESVIMEPLANNNMEVLYK